MKTKQKNFLLLAGLLSVSLLCVALAPLPANAQIPEKFENLQVLSKDANRMELISVMRDMTFALGTKCSYCHEGEGDDLSTFNFAADSKPGKKVTRVMMRMTNEMNDNYLSEIAAESAVTCQMCHQGQLKPEE